jgi:hypothetical protein
MDQILELHDGSHYFMFAKEFIKLVVGSAVWKKNFHQANLSTYCSASGEAFALLTVENNYNRWQSMSISGDHRDKGGLAPAALYTNSGKSDRGRGGTRRFQGWSKEGYDRFDELHGLVMTDRAKSTRLEFEKELREQLESEYSSKRRQKATENLDEGEDIYPAHDFDDVGRNPKTRKDDDSAFSGQEDLDDMQEEGDLYDQAVHDTHDDASSENEAL